MNKVFVVTIKDYYDVHDSLSPHNEVLCVTGNMAEGKRQAEEWLYKGGVINVVWHESSVFERASSELRGRILIAAEVRAYFVQGAAKQQNGQ